MRIVFGGFQHETNTFAPTRADYAAFERGGGFPGLSRGDAVFAALGDANLPAAGFCAAARAAGHELVPTVWASTSPSAHVTREAYERIAGAIVDGVRAALPVDAVYLDLHGAMVAEHVDDGEGELLARVRAVIGPDVPLLASLDLHANVTQRMLAQADALLAYRTYPHVDMSATGRRTYALLEKRVALGRRHAVAARRLPFLIPICWQSTLDEPGRGLYGALAALERESPGTHLSFAMGFPAADFAECGPVVWAYADTEAEARRLADALGDEAQAAESRFHGELLPADEAVRTALALARDGHKPVVISDAQDNPGAGANSDTTGLLRALIAQRAERVALGLIVDPAAARAAHAAGVGVSLRIAVGGRAGIPGDEPFEYDFVVEALSDGQLTTQGPFYGHARLQLGPSACLRAGGVRVVVASVKAQMADQAMFRYVGIEPTEQDIVVVKSTIHYRADFQPIAARLVTAIAPGPMMMLPTGWRWQHLPPSMRLYPGGPTQAECQQARA